MKKSCVNVILAIVLFHLVSSHSSAEESVVPQGENIEQNHEKVNVVDPKQNEKAVLPSLDDSDIKYFEELKKSLHSTPFREHQKVLDLIEEFAMKTNYSEALEIVGFSYLFGSYRPRNVSYASELFQQLSLNGSAGAQLGLSFIYATGLETNLSMAKAVIYSTFSALGGNSLAQLFMGYIHLNGIAVEQNCEQALTYYQKVAYIVKKRYSILGSANVFRTLLHEEAEQSTGYGQSVPLTSMDTDLLQYYEFLADKGDLQAQLGLGQLYLQGGKYVEVDHDKAFHYLLKAAEQNSGLGLAYLGKMYLEGTKATPQDNETALAYFKKSAARSSATGVFGLAYIHYHGYGMAKDHSRAATFAQQAAEDSSSEAQLLLGTMHYAGHGVEQDYRQALRYFHLASQSANLMAVYNLAFMHATGIGSIRSCQISVDLFKTVAERGPWARMFMEAYHFYRNGKSETALLMYMMLAQAGYEAAQANAAYLLDKGVGNKLFGVEEAWKRALFYWIKAANQGSAFARLKLGDYHYYGQGTTVNYESAARYYRQAGELQNAQAYFNLAYMHEQGMGLPRDLHLAKRYYDMASEAGPEAATPVALAMMHLRVLLFFEAFRSFDPLQSVVVLDPRIMFGRHWEMYLATFLCLIATLLCLLLRLR